MHLSSDAHCPELVEQDPVTDRVKCLTEIHVDNVRLVMPLKVGGNVVNH